MKPTLIKAIGYKGDVMNLPVADIDAAVPFYTTVLGFREHARVGSPRRAVVLERDDMHMRLVENGGDPTQDGCAFHVTGLQQLFDEFQAHGLNNPPGAFSTEQRGGATFQVFYVVAPDGLCYWFGERQGD